jgi:hypothetical protein
MLLQGGFEMMLSQEQYLRKLNDEVLHELADASNILAMVNSKDCSTSEGTASVVQAIRTAIDMLKATEMKANLLHAHLHAIDR